MKRSLILSLPFLFVMPFSAQSSFLDFGKELLNQIEPAHDTKASPSKRRGMASGLSNRQITSGLKGALRVGTKKAVSIVGRPGGFTKDRNIRIPLPGPLAKVKSGLKFIGASGLADDLETRMNKAAEMAAPKAANIFGKAVSRMSIADARGILTGPSDSATRYFRRTTSDELIAAMKPIIDKSLANAGVLKSYNRLTSKMQALPLAGAVDMDVNNYVANKTLDGIFYYLAKQEADIRANPAARTTDILRTVFK